jgi:eukaryotic-like serine/threonine-protein kinase
LKFVRRHELGQFEVVAHLATGGMAEVYLARDVLSHELAVVKMLSKQAENEAELVSMFRQEGRIMANLGHPNVVRILGLGEHDNLPYIVMEYLDGDHLGVLFNIIRRRCRMLPAPVLARIFMQASNALDYIHQAKNRQGQALGLVHRDVSPQNISLCYDGRVKLLDFGITLANDREVFTRTGMLKGKIRYMSPEQINSEPLDGRSDIFSLGIVMWELSTGERLFKSSSEYKTMKLVCEDPIASPQSLRPDLPDDFVSIIMSCLERPIENRFQSAAALRQALSEFLFSPAGTSRADELVQLAKDLLGERAAKKKSFIEGLHHQTEMQEYLFGDLGDGLDESSQESYKINNKPSDSFRPVQPPSSPFPQDPPQSLGEPGSGRFPLMLIMLGLLFLLLFSGAGWLLCRAMHAKAPAGAGDAGSLHIDAGRMTVQIDAGATLSPGDEAQAPVVDAGPIDDRDGDGETEIEQSGDENELPPDEGNVGFLRFDSNPPTEVYLHGRFLGKTPIVDLRLAPGRYKLQLLNGKAGISKIFYVRIRKNQVTSQKVIY